MAGGSLDGKHTNLYGCAVFSTQIEEDWGASEDNFTDLRIIFVQLLHVRVDLPSHPGNYLLMEYYMEMN